MYRLLNRHIFLFIASLIGCAFLSGCVSDLGEPFAKPKDTVSIRFYSSERTRADGDPENGVTSLNENKLHNISVALSPLGAEDADACIKFHTFSNLDENAEYNGVITLSDEEVASLFGASAANGAQCRVYAVANLSWEILSSLEGAIPSISALKDIVVSSSFATKQVQDDFVMFGEGQVSLSKDGDTQSAAGTVALYRTASKITLNINLPDQLEVTNDDGSKTTWIPLSGSGAMRVLLNRGVESSTVVSDGSANSADSYYDINTRSDNTYGFTDNYQNYPTYRWKQTYPFYTYPNTWTNSLSETNRTYLTLIIPWYKSTEGSSSYETFYYSVPVTKSDMPKLTSNYSYTIDLNVGMLGSLEPEMPEEITGSYKVVNWMREDMDLNINDYRYLVVNEPTYIIDNLESFTISFYSSHDVEVSDITMTYKRFSFITQTGNANMGAVVNFPTSKDVIDISKSGNYTMVDYSKEITKNPRTKMYDFNLTHELKIWTPVDDPDATTITAANTVSQSSYPSLSDSTSVQGRIKKYLRPENPDPAYSPYVFRVTLRHKDKHSFTESFTIIQRPGMFIEAAKNPGNSTVSGHPGYNYVNGNGTNNLGGVSTLNGSNKNPNMYIITISTLDANSKYYIGDPRTLYINNNLYSRTGDRWNGYQYPSLLNPTQDGAADTEWSTRAQALYPNTNQRRLTYYYPTIESDDDYYKMMIAPKLRVASSYGTTTAINRNNARRRCATYQEYNCPAGRWRLPTYGELLYIINLSASGKIPTLFTTGGDGYWCAQGAYVVNTNGTLTKVDDSESHFVRAVYDEWYWEKETEYTLNVGNGYTLGDMPKRNSQD